MEKAFARDNKGMIKNLKWASDGDDKKSKTASYDINPDFGFSTVPDVMDNPMNDSPLRDQYRTAYLRWSQKEKAKPRTQSGSATNQEFGVDNAGGLLSPGVQTGVQAGKSTNPLTLRTSPNPNMRYTPTTTTTVTTATTANTTSYEEQQIRLQMQQMKLPKFLTEHLDNKDSKNSSGEQL